MAEWVACISQTGEELVRICEFINRVPDKIVATNQAKLIDKVYMLNTSLIITGGRPTHRMYEHVFRTADLITLHGFLYIIPPEFCEKRIVNGHPGLITEFPELKGKDKQKDVLNNKEKYPEIGSVIHLVTPEVDEGPILYSCRRLNTTCSESELFLKFKETSFSTWIQFFNDYLQDNLPCDSEGIHWVYGERPWDKEGVKI